MTAPISGFITATPASALSYWAIQISGTDQGVEISKALEDAVAAELILSGTSTVGKDVNGFHWTITVTDPNGRQSMCTTGDWIVIGTDSTGKMLSLNFYNGPNGPYNNPPYSTEFAGS